MNALGGRGMWPTLRLRELPPKRFLAGSTDSSISDGGKRVATAFSSSSSFSSRYDVGVTLGAKVTGRWAGAAWV
jgi:hypothetical protein